MNAEIKMSEDKVYAKPMARVDAFRFDAGVADVFQDMIERSVPGYGLVLDLIGVVAECYGMPESNAYDLGCSLGASTLQLRRHLPSDCTVIGVDNSPAMIERCQANMARDHSAAAFEIREQDLRETRIESASIVVLNFTLQFVPSNERLAVLKSIYEGLKPGGVIVLAEKTLAADDNRQSLLTELHHQFKKLHGYSDLEVAQKRAALENVLVPDTQTIHEERLRLAGFGTVEQCVHCLNFSTFLGIK
ncbi:MAG: tRNA (cmo5U34)-methyltransferase [Candidatus Azotimanducaceae bacterium]